jgi:putative transposase
VRYAWIATQRGSYEVSLLCEVLEVSRSGWYAAQRRKPSERAQRNARLLQEIGQCQQRHRGRYGRRRMQRELRAITGEPISEKLVGRLMRQANQQCQQRRRFRVVTTDSRHSYPVAPNVLQRQFTASAPNQKWLGDVTYVPTREGWLYLALVLDLFSRKLVGWATSDSPAQQLTLQALHMALGWRRPPVGLVHHVDRGSSYASQRYREVLANHSIVLSMSRKGDCWDNAPMESVNATVKLECVYPSRFKTRVEAAQTLIEYFGYYNTQRRHSKLGYVTPSEYELRCRQQKAVQ